MSDLDIFIEKMIRKNKDIYDYLIIIGVLILGLILMVALAPLLKSFLPLLFAAIGYGVYLAITSRNIEFEYIVTNDELDVERLRLNVVERGYLHRVAKILILLLELTVNILQMI